MKSSLPKSDEIGKRILLLETAAASRQVLETAVRDAGFEPEFLTDIVSVLELARLLRPAAVVTAVFPPRLLGLTLCHQIRSDPLTALIPVYVTSFLSMEEAALEAGASAFFLKPLQPDALIRRLQTLAPLNG